ncbi:hypothetical protein [Arcticibacter sp. MXS-1]|uniref:hypothetical protein n=1 Tax=Arcticibacter sp. MXS-1 TaxID=3341726 RepID=UPI0035A96BE7
MKTPKPSYASFRPVILLSLTIALAIAGTDTSAQTDSIALIARWKKGEGRNYLIKKAEVRYTNGALTTNDSSSYTVSVTVTDSSRTNYNLDWRSESPLLSNKTYPELAGLDEKYQNLSVKYSTDQNGAFQKLLNRDEIIQMMNEALDLYVAQKKDTGSLSSDNVEAVKQIFSSPGTIEGLALKEISLFHFPYGVWYHYGSTFEYQEQIGVPLLGAPVASTGRLTLESIDTLHHTCRIKNSVQLDSVSSKKAIATMLEVMVAKSTFKSEQEKQTKLQEMRKAFSTMELTIDRESVFEINYSTGWPIPVVFTQNTFASTPEEGGLRRLETVSVTAVDK